MQIYCDDPSHKRRSVVLTLPLVSAGRQLWLYGDRLDHVDPKDRAISAAMAAATANEDWEFVKRIVDHLKEEGRLDEFTRGGPGQRSLWDLTCRKCKDRPVWVRSDKFDQMRDHARRVGRRELTLREVAAILALLARGNAPG